MNSVDPLGLGSWLSAERLPEASEQWFSNCSMLGNTSESFSELRLLGSTPINRTGVGLRIRISDIASRCSWFRGHALRATDTHKACGEGRY